MKINIQIQIHWDLKIIIQIQIQFLNIWKQFKLNNIWKPKLKSSKLLSGFWFYIQDKVKNKISIVCWRGCYFLVEVGPPWQVSSMIPQQFSSLWRDSVGVWSRNFPIQRQIRKTLYQGWVTGDYFAINVWPYAASKLHWVNFYLISLILSNWLYRQNTKNKFSYVHFLIRRKWF